MPNAIVTGADSGIGKATAVKLAERGFDLSITWHSDEDGIRDTAREVESHGRRAELRQVDLADVRQGGQVVAELADALGGVDVLVNNAGTGTSEPFVDMDLETWQNVIDVDLTAAFLATQEAARRMIDAGRGGRIVNVTSVHEHVPLEGAGPYVAAKHGLGGFTKVAALELAKHGITVNAGAPGEVATPMTGNEDVDPATVDRPGLPAGRPGHAREIANAIAFLASDEASYVTGESLVVGGGLMLMAAMANQIAMD